MGEPGAGVTFLPAFPFTLVPVTSWQAKFVPILPNILLTAFSIAIVATFDTLLTLRITQKRAGRPINPVRDLVAQGIGNCVAACTGALATQLSPNVVLSGYESGGRTAAMPLVGGAVLLFLVLAMSPALAAIPVVVLQATVLANGISQFDRWSLRLLFDTAINRGRVARRHAWHDLLVVLVVMGITASGAIIAGVLAGAALACIIFIANMSRPIFRRIHRGNEIFSKRLRPADDAALLLATGRKRLVIELQGVLFFGNADALADRLVALFDDTDMITLDVRGITDIDISGAQVLHEIVANARRRAKWLIFCNVPPDVMRTVGELVAGDARFGPRIMPDLDSAIEWMEEEALRGQSAGRPPVEQLALEQLDLVKGLDADELALLRSLLVPRAFAPGETLCAEGEVADRLWLLTRGTVSVRMALHGHEDVRIASLAMGTVVGEMALLASGHRSATVVADVDVLCYELEEAAVRALLDEHPRIASKILRNFAREMARRVRTTSEYLRHALG
jgi:CRP-like cAMP-binding protein/anti-anti-sigma regulatory factor